MKRGDLVAHGTLEVSFFKIIQSASLHIKAARIIMGYVVTLHMSLR